MCLAVGSVEHAEHILQESRIRLVLLQLIAIHFHQSIAVCKTALGEEFVDLSFQRLDKLFAFLIGHFQLLLHGLGCKRIILNIGFVPCLISDSFVQRGVSIIK